MSARIFHNPRCSKSRQTLALIEEQGVPVEIVEYLKTPPSAQEIKELIAQMGVSARDIMRKGEAVYKELALGAEDKSEEQLVTAMHENPILIERPIVQTDKGVCIGRPPENVKQII